MFKPSSICYYKLADGNPRSFRNQFEIFNAVLVVGFELEASLNLWFLLYNTLCKLVVFIVDSGRFFFLLWQIQGALNHRAAYWGHSLELGWSTGPVNLFLLFLKIKKRFVSFMKKAHLPSVFLGDGWRDVRSFDLSHFTYLGQWRNCGFRGCACRSCLAVQI